MRRTVRTLAAPLVARSGDWHSGESGAELGDDGLDVAAVQPFLQFLDPGLERGGSLAVERFPCFPQERGKLGPWLATGRRQGREARWAVAVNDEDPVRQEGVEGDVEIES
jgi:hypothetical protein